MKFSIIIYEMDLEFIYFKATQKQENKNNMQLDTL